MRDKKETLLGYVTRASRRAARLSAFIAFVGLAAGASCSRTAAVPTATEESLTSGALAPASELGQPAEIQLAPSIITGDVGDVRITSLPDDVTQFTYDAQGRGPHEWEYKYTDDGEESPEAARQAGVVWTISQSNGLAASASAGFDFRPHKPTHIQWEARSTGPDVWVGFHLGGMVWQWQKGLVGWRKQRSPFPDSVPYTPLGVRKLTGDWQSFDCALPEGLDLSHVVAAFAWTANWDDNSIESPGAATFGFQVRGVRYFSPTPAARSSVTTGVVYREAAEPFQMFLPSGAMGDIGDVKTRVTCEENPHSGKTCIKVVYAAKGLGPHECLYGGPCRWAGSRWHYPPSNWGKDEFWRNLGRDLSAYSTLTFWARAEKECTVEFLVGGADTPYGDSLRTPLRHSFPLTRSWNQYSIPLEGDMTHITSGFGWASNWTANPAGAVFFLDDIEFRGAARGVASVADPRIDVEKARPTWRVIVPGVVLGVVASLTLGVCGGLVPAALRQWLASRGEFVCALCLVLAALLGLRFACDQWIPFPGGALVGDQPYFLSERVALFGAVITALCVAAVVSYCGAPHPRVAILGIMIVVVGASVAYPLVFALSWSAAARAPLVVAMVVAQTVRYATIGHSGPWGLGMAILAALTLTKGGWCLMPRLRAAYRGALSWRTDAWIALTCLAWLALGAEHVVRDNRPVWAADGTGTKSVLPTSFVAPPAFNATKMLRYAQSSGLESWRVEGLKELTRAINAAASYRSHDDLSHCGKLAAEVDAAQHYQWTINAAASLDWSNAQPSLEALLVAGDCLEQPGNEKTILPAVIDAFRGADSTEGRTFNLAVCAKHCVRHGDHTLARQCLEDAMETINTLQVVDQRRAAMAVVFRIAQESSEEYALAAIPATGKLWFFEDRLEPLTELARLSQAQGWRQAARDAITTAVNGYREKSREPDPSRRLLAEWSRWSDELARVAESLSDAELAADIRDAGNGS